MDLTLLCKSPLKTLSHADDTIGGDSQDNQEDNVFIYELESTFADNETGGTGAVSSYENGYQSDTDSSATTCWQSPKSTRSSIGSNSPLRRLLRKSPKPVAVVSPTLMNTGAAPFKKCLSRTTRFKRKLLHKKEAAPEKGAESSKEKTLLLQAVLEDYFKVKKKKNRYKKEVKNLKTTLKRVELKFAEPDDIGFDTIDTNDIFKDNISAKLDATMKSQYSREVLAHVKQHSDTINSQLSTMAVTPRSMEKPCGCLSFDDEICDTQETRYMESQQTQGTTQSLSASNCVQRSSSQRSSSQRSSQSFGLFPESSKLIFTLSQLKYPSSSFSFDDLSSTPARWHSF